MIKLYSFGPAFNLPDPSPFVTKVDLTLRMAGLEYDSISSSSNLQKAPKAKLPFIEDKGKIIADSMFILEHLKTEHAVDFDGWLTKEQNAFAQLIGKSLDENLYWTIVYSRWIKDDVWPTVKSQFFDPLPFPLNHIIASYARRSTRKQILGHGMGKHSDQEITEIAHNSWSSLSTILADKPYFFGDKMCSFDVTAFAMLASFTVCSLETDLGNQVQQYENLMSFSQRIAQKYYPNEIVL
jgi:glutathione S-transferase